MNKVILLTASYKGKPLEIVKSLVPEGFSLVSLDTNSHEELVEKARTADYILASGNLKIDADVLEGAKNLRMIQRLGVGLDALDFQVLDKCGIPVYVNKGVNANSVAEHTLMFILILLRKLIPINETTKSGVWKKQEQGVETHELAEQTVGIIGMGNIGKRVANLLSGFGCRSIYYSGHPLKKDEEDALRIAYRPLEQLFEQADVITLHCPLTDETRNLINKDNIAKMKKGVLLVNTSRGGLIQESDLLEALDSQHVGAAALDVYQNEPAVNSALLRHNNVICTPHIAGNTYDSFRKMMDMALRNILLFDQGELDAVENCRVQKIVS